MLLGAAGMTATWGTLTFSGQYLTAAGLWLLLLVHGLVLSLIFTVFALVRELFPQRIAGTAFGMFNVMPFLGTALVQPAMGWIVKAASGGGYELLGFQTAFAFGLVLQLLAVALVARLGRA